MVLHNTTVISGHNEFKVLNLSPCSLAEIIGASLAGCIADGRGSCIPRCPFKVVSSFSTRDTIGTERFSDSNTLLSFLWRVMSRTTRFSAMYTSMRSKSSPYGSLGQCFRCRWSATHALLLGAGKRAVVSSSAMTCFSRSTAEAGVNVFFSVSVILTYVMMHAFTAVVGAAGLIVATCI